MANMFDKAKKTPAKAVKKDEKILVDVKGVEFGKAVNIAAINDTKIKELKAELDTAKAVIKEKAIEEFVKLYEDNKRNVGSFNLVAENGASFMFLPTKRYLKVDDDRAENLQENYGEEVISETTAYAFNTAVLTKHMDKISELLMGASFLSKDEKGSLIEASSTYTVKKDILDEFYVMKSEKSVEIEDCFEDFAPVCQIKYLKEAKE
jgi:hypothetical protein